MYQDYKQALLTGFFSMSQPYLIEMFLVGGIPPKLIGSVLRPCQELAGFMTLKRLTGVCLSSIGSQPRN
jgi:hypothetical protein